jgi:omega-6 fatty acid desaturase (delta-12 desaturase)
MALISSRPPSLEALSAYAQPRTARGMLDIGTSAGAYLALCVALYLMLRVSPWLVVLLVVPTAGFLVRVFVVFHDCAHGSLLPSKRANTWAGTVLGLLVLTPFRPWRHEHVGHHATSGDLDRRGMGDVETLTVAEYQARSWRGRLAYRLFRHPVVMFGLGPVFAMIIEPRLVARGTQPRIRNSVLGTNAALVVIVGALCWLIGWEDFLIVWAPAGLLAGSVGIWLFYVQHQFEDAYWQRHGEWSYAEAALRGSSYLKLPKLLQFFTGNIGLHHVHHLNPRIPNYNLQRAHDANAIFASVPTVSVRAGLRAVKFKLWDEDAGQLVTFTQANLHPATGAHVISLETAVSALQQFVKKGLDNT